MKNNQEQYKEQFINIPYSVMKRDDLSQTQKMIYGLIKGFDDTGIVCYAKNTYISDVIGIKDPTTISKSISKLYNLGLITKANPKGRSRSLTTLVKRPNNLGENTKLTLAKKPNNNIVNNINKNIVYNIQENFDKITGSSSKSYDDEEIIGYNKGNPVYSNSIDKTIDSLESPF